MFAGAVSAQNTADPVSIWQRVTLYRDEWGTPHVYADDFHALAFAFGWAQAEDHLEPMLAAYRIADGRGAEIYGESYAESDEFALKLGHGMLARSALPNLDALTQDLCAGFAMGVNAWIVEHPEQTPVWADGVKPEDVLALLHCYLMSFAPFDFPGAYRRTAPAATGNAWALGPARSATGEPMLAINPHGAYDGPFRWYEAHLVCQDMNVSGATLFGLPVILQGHNGALGWALTPNQPDFADIFIEPPFGGGQGDPKSLLGRGAQTVTDDRVLQMMLLANTRTYFVSTPDGPVEKSVACLDTPRGPVVGSDRGRILSYQVGGYRDFGTIAQLAQMGSAQDLPAFQAALAMHQLPCFHVVYADRGGNIFYLYNAKMGNKPDVEVPLAIEEETVPPAVIDWSTPMLAARFGWTGIIPVETLPAVVNPASGYVQACGNPPWAATEGSGIAPGAFPKWFSADRDTYRAQRVRRMLGIGRRSFLDCQAMLYDMVVPLAVEIVPKLIAAAESRKEFLANAHPDTALGIATLKDWNFTADPSSTGMTFFHAWWASLQSQNLAAQLGGQDFFAALKAGKPAALDAALNAAADAARMMRNEFNSLTVPWGDVHSLARGEREVPAAGGMSGEPILVASDFVYDSKKWRVTYGYGYAMVVSFGETINAASVVPFGSSENPASEHYADQLALMTAGSFKRAWFTHEEVQRHAATARGRIVYLRPEGMEALFALQSAEPVEARLDASVKSPGDLPAGLAAFTMFVRPETTPRRAAVETHMEIRIPEVLCAKQDLGELAVYAHDGAAWAKVDQQELDTETRTFSAYGGHGTPTYCVLGPARLRAERLPIPGEAEAPVLTPEVESQPAQVENAGAAQTDSQAQSSQKWWWGLPPQPVKPQPSARPNLRPPGTSVPSFDNMVGEPELPKLTIIPPEAVDAAKAAGKEEGATRRNFNRNLPGAHAQGNAAAAQADARNAQKEAERQAAELNRRAKKEQREREKQEKKLKKPMQ